MSSSEKVLTLETLAWKRVFRRLREERGLTQKALRQLVRIKTSPLWERGHRPSQASLARVEAHLGFEPDKLTVLHAAEVMNLGGYLLDEVGAKEPSEYDQLREVSRAMRTITFPDSNLHERMKSDQLVLRVVEELAASARALIDQFRRLESSLAFTKDSS